MGVAFAVVSGAAVLRKSRSVFVDAAVIDCDRGTFFVLEEISGNWNFRDLRAARFLLFYGLLSGLGGHFLVRQSIFCFADCVFRAGTGRSSGCDCVPFPQPDSRIGIIGCGAQHFHRLESGTGFPVGRAPNSSPGAGILEPRGSESASPGAKADRCAIAILSFSPERSPAPDRAARYGTAKTLDAEMNADTSAILLCIVETPSFPRPFGVRHRVVFRMNRSTMPCA